MSEAEALARTTIDPFRAWGLTDTEARTLLGGVTAHTRARWKTGEIGRIDRDLKMRMGPRTQCGFRREFGTGHHASR